MGFQLNAICLLITICLVDQIKSMNVDQPQQQILYNRDIGIPYLGVQRSNLDNNLRNILGQLSQKRSWNSLHGSWGKRYGLSPWNDGTVLDETENIGYGGDDNIDDLLAIIAGAHENNIYGNGYPTYDENSYGANIVKRSRSNNDGKRLNNWNKFRGGWGKRENGWNNLKGLWGKRASSQSWNRLGPAWGKRSEITVDPVSQTSNEEPTTVNEN